MTTTSLNMRIEPRTDSGKGNSRALRIKGMIPGILYGSGQDNIKLAVDPRDVLKGLKKRNFYNYLFEFQLNGKNERALCKAVQLHPVTEQPLHIDLMRVVKDSYVKINVPIYFINQEECPGLKTGGILNIVIRSLKIQCSIENIPECFTIDLKRIEAGTSIYISDLKLSDDYKLLRSTPKDTIANIAASNSKKSEEPTSTA